MVFDNVTEFGSKRRHRKRFDQTRSLRSQQHIHSSSHNTHSMIQSIQYHHHEDVAVLAFLLGRSALSSVPLSLSLSVLGSLSLSLSFVFLLCPLGLKNPVICMLP